MRSKCIKGGLQEDLTLKELRVSVDLYRAQGHCQPFWGFPVIIMAGHSPPVCYAIEKVLMQPMRVSTTASVKFARQSKCLRHPIPSLDDTAARFECFDRRRIVPHYPKSHAFIQKVISVNGKYHKPSPFKGSLDQALPSSTAALIEAKNFAGQVDNSASLGMPFSRTCLMMLCCSLAINS